MSGIGGMHIGRAWVGTQFEQDCPCVKAPCGLVDSGNTSADCPQHQITKTIRQGHRAEDCPGSRNEEAARRITSACGTGFHGICNSIMCDCQCHEQ